MTMNDIIMTCAEYLWNLHWIFRINFFLILYCFIGPSILGYITPEMPLKKRNILMLSTMMISLTVLYVGRSYDNELYIYRHKECIKKLHLEYSEDTTACSTYHMEGLDDPNSLNDKSSTFNDAIITKILLRIIIRDPLMVTSLFIWCLWHRKTIKKMEKASRGTKFLFFMMNSYFWMIFIPSPIVGIRMICFLIVSLVYYITGTNIPFI